MNTLLQELFKKVEESARKNELKEPLQVLHPYIAEGYSDLLEDTEWSRSV